jgi:hypothetical protein
MSIERPSVKTLQRNQAAYPEWVVCPVCRGGRGEVVPIYDEETGEHIDYTVQPCPLCAGEKVIPRLR